MCIYLICYIPISIACTVAIHTYIATSYTGEWQGKLSGPNNSSHSLSQKTPTHLCHNNIATLL